MSNSPSSGSDGLAFTDNISIDWLPVEQTPDEARLAMVNESNETFLRAVSVVGAFAGELSEEEVGISQEIARLDLKMNLLLDLVSQLIYQQADIPPKTEVTVSSEAIEWRGDNIPGPGATVFVKAYIQHGTPKPLCFYGEVISDGEAFAAGIARVRYLGLSDSAQSWLDKLIFRHHRREVAFKRSRRERD